MAHAETVSLDFGALLKAVEDAAPTAAVDVVGTHLRMALGATQVAFLIADLSGRSLIRLGEVAAGAGHAAGPETVALVGSTHGRVLLRQDVEVEAAEDGLVRVIAPEQPWRSDRCSRAHAPRSTRPAGTCRRGRGGASACVCRDRKPPLHRPL